MPSFRIVSAPLPGIAAQDQPGFAGHRDWRPPPIGALVRILDRRRPSGGAPVSRGVSFWGS